jgi:hypothetical protein
MDDEHIYQRGGDERDVVEYAKRNGADLTKRDIELSKLIREKAEFIVSLTRFGTALHVNDILPDLQEIAVKAQAETRTYRDHLCFLYRWISRLNGDKPHDRPETEWRSYVGVMVHYPSAPWQTGDWFED